MDTTTPLPLPATIPVAGISLRQSAARSCTPRSSLTLEAEPDNPHDTGAIRVLSDDGTHLGYIPAALNRRLGAHPLETLAVRIEEILDRNDTIGLRIRVHSHTHDSGGETQQVAYTTTGAKIGVVTRQHGNLVTCTNADGNPVTYPSQVLTICEE